MGFSTIFHSVRSVFHNMILHYRNESCQIFCISISVTDISFLLQTLSYLALNYIKLTVFWYIFFKLHEIPENKSLESRYKMLGIDGIKMSGFELIY